MSASQELLQALEHAIQAEIEGYHFYTMAADATPDERGREVFRQLADEEVKHAEYLRAQYRSLAEKGRVDASAVLDGEPAFGEGTSFFTPELEKRATKAHFEMTALSVGAQLEADAIRFYQEQAARAEDPAVRSFLLELAEWERGHHDALVSQMRALEKEYWAANRFAPF